MESLPSKELLAWAYLARVVEGPNRAITGHLAAGRDPEEIAVGIARREPWVGEDLLRATAARHLVHREREDLERAARAGARLLTPRHNEWPAEPLDQAFSYASAGCSEHISRHRGEAVAPHALWVRGRGLGQALRQAVSVVGTRAATGYGQAATRMLVEGLVAHQWTIVSGGAYGVDTVAHHAALDGGGVTVAVVACGIDRSYPAANRGLFDSIVAGGGCVVSEYPPGSDPRRHRFLTRNRLIAALSQGTVVTEAAWRSGALNTLGWANGLGKVAMAVPGPITAVGSLGCHRKIRDGQARIVVSADDIRELVGPLGDVDADAQYEIEFEASPAQRLPVNELKVFDALPRTGAASAEDIAQATGMTLALTVHLLYALSKKGLVRLAGNDWERSVA